MTENETIEIIGNIPIDGKDKCYSIEQYQDAKTKAIEVLEEVKRYRTIGTPEECQTAMELYKEMHKRKFTLEAVEEYMKFEDELVRRGLTFGNLLEIMDKNIPQNPDLEGDGYSDGNLVYDTWICPCCGKYYEVDYEKYDFCPNCGQAIDWSVGNEDTD